VVVVLGTLVIFTFDPCPPDAPAELLASFCTA
jgi:succinate dehydrogenase / fumarate reductase membrane anchor subunit